MQAAGGHIDITQARLAQGDILAVGAGTLALTPAGRLDGQITLTVAGLEKLMALLGVDQVVSQYPGAEGGGLNVDKIASGLDRFMPGLAARCAEIPAPVSPQSASACSASRRSSKAAVRSGLPLRFADGTAFLGPIAVGQMPPLF